MNLPSKNCFLQRTNAAVRWQPRRCPYTWSPMSTLKAPARKENPPSGALGSPPPSRGTWRSFTCPGSRVNVSPALGVTGSPEGASSREMSRAMFQSLRLIVDSDKAFATTQENGGAGILKKNPQSGPLFGRLGREEQPTGMGDKRLYMVPTPRASASSKPLRTGSCAPLNKFGRALSVTALNGAHSQ